jgi:large subunit ribosomal protein L15
MKPKLGNLPPRKSIRERRRVGRGHGSGWVKTAGKGQKGQTSRSGVSFPGYFTGGTLGLSRRLPKLGGFKPLNKITYTAVNLDVLNRFEAGTTVTREMLIDAGIIRSKATHIKLLARGEVDRVLTVVTDQASKVALEKMEKAGCKVEVTGKPSERKLRKDKKNENRIKSIQAAKDKAIADAAAPKKEKKAKKDKSAEE